MASVSEQKRFQRHACIGLITALAPGFACGYNPGYRSNAGPKDYSATTTTGAVWRPDLTSDAAQREEEARREQRLERELEERQQRARALAGSETAEDVQAGTATLEERSSFDADLRSAIASIDADTDDLRSRAAMAGPEARARVDPVMKQVAEVRAQLEQTKKRLERAGGDEWRRARDDAQSLVDEAKRIVRAGRAAL